MINLDKGCCLSVTSNYFYPIDREPPAIIPAEVKFFASDPIDDCTFTFGINSQPVE
jgi:hypothetical protein